MQYTWDFSFVYTNWHILLSGLLNTLKLAAVSLTLGMLIGLFVGLGQLSHRKVVKFISIAYVECFRNLPGIVLIFWFYYAIPIVTAHQVPVFVASFVALSLYTGGYCAEIYRAGIQSISKTQWEAARAIGMNNGQAFRLVIWPQALRRTIPPFCSRAIELVKSTTLASTLAYGDLLYNAKLIAEDQLRPLEAYTLATLIFTAILLPLSYLCIRLEHRIKTYS